MHKNQCLRPYAFCIADGFEDGAYYEEGPCPETKEEDIKALLTHGLHTAVKNKDEAYVQHLLALGAHLDELDDQGYAPLHYAAYKFKEPQNSLSAEQGLDKESAYKIENAFWSFM